MLKERLSVAINSKILVKDAKFNESAVVIKNCRRLELFEVQKQFF